MIRRKMESLATKLWRQYPVVTITGPRQSGKTTLARAVFPKCEYVNLESPDVRMQIRADARGFFARHPAPVIFDEIQNAPELVSYIQVEVDERHANSMYVLTGSHQPALRAAISQSLAGRTALLQLLPLSIGELSGAGMEISRDQLIFNGFMPRLYDSGIEPTQLYSDYFQTYIERDVRQLINLRNLREFELFVRLLAGRVGQLLNRDSLASDVGVSSQTIAEWLSVLEASYVIYTLRPYYRNVGKRLVKSPKIYFTDVGLAAYLIGLTSVDQVATHPLVGNLFENMVVMDALKARTNRGRGTDLYFMRDYRGLETDLVVENGVKLDLYEIKSAMSFNPSFADSLVKLRQSIDCIGRTKVVYSGDKASLGEVEFVNFASLSL